MSTNWMVVILFGFAMAALIAEQAFKPTVGTQWLSECAIHRPLADCKVDYERLHR